MRIFENTNYDFIRWRWHAIALSTLIVLAGVAFMVSRGGIPLGIDFTGGTIVVAKFETDGRRGRGSPGARGGAGREGRPELRRPGRQLGADPAAPAPRRRRGQPGPGRPRHRRGARCGRIAEVRDPVAGDRRPGHRPRAAAEGHLRHPGLDRRHRRLHRHPVPPGVRHRRHRRDAARRARHAGVPGDLRLRPVAQHRRRAAHHHRLLGERHHRHLRPGAREHARQDAPRPAREGGQRRRQPDA